MMPLGTRLLHMSTPLQRERNTWKVINNWQSPKLSNQQKNGTITSFEAFHAGADPARVDAVPLSTSTFKIDSQSVHCFITSDASAWLKTHCELLHHALHQVPNARPGAVHSAVALYQDQRRAAHPGHGCANPPRPDKTGNVAFCGEQSQFSYLKNEKSLD